jgi:prophage DNA circulation protein
MPDPGPQYTPAANTPGQPRNPPVPAVITGPRAASIFEIPNTAWRDTLVPASFNGAQFHCEQHSLESGRRLVEHEFPKRDLPYAEDLGHRAITWEVRGYIIAYPFDVSNSVLYQRDYREGRDALMRELLKGGPFKLQVQTLPSLTVYCERFRLTEQEKLGGYCTFDMTFREMGTIPFSIENTRTSVILRSTELRDQILARMAMT